MSFMALSGENSVLGFKSHYNSIIFKVRASMNLVHEFCMIMEIFNQFCSKGSRKEFNMTICPYLNASTYCVDGSKI